MLAKRSNITPQQRAEVVKRVQRCGKVIDGKWDKYLPEQILDSFFAQDIVIAFVTNNMFGRVEWLCVCLLNNTTVTYTSNTVIVTYLTTTREFTLNEFNMFWLCHSKSFYDSMSLAKLLRSYADYSNAISFDGAHYVRTIRSHLYGGALSPLYFYSWKELVASLKPTDRDSAHNDFYKPLLSYLVGSQTDVLANGVVVTYQGEEHTYTLGHYVAICSAYVASRNGDKSISSLYSEELDVKPRLDFTPLPEVKTFYKFLGDSLETQDEDYDKRNKYYPRAPGVPCMCDHANGHIVFSTDDTVLATKRTDSPADFFVCGLYDRLTDTFVNYDLPGKAPSGFEADWYALPETVDSTYPGLIRFEDNVAYFTYKDSIVVHVDGGRINIGAGYLDIPVLGAIIGCESCVVRVTLGDTDSPSLRIRCISEDVLANLGEIERLILTEFSDYKIEDHIKTFMKGDYSNRLGAKDSNLNSTNDIQHYSIRMETISGHYAAKRLIYPSLFCTTKGVKEIVNYSYRVCDQFGVPYLPSHVSYKYIKRNCFNLLKGGNPGSKYPGKFTVRFFVGATVVNSMEYYYTAGRRPIGHRAEPAAQQLFSFASAIVSSTLTEAMASITDLLANHAYDRPLAMDQDLRAHGIYVPWPEDGTSNVCDLIRYLNLHCHPNPGEAERIIHVLKPEWRPSKRVYNPKRSLDVEEVAPPPTNPDHVDDPVVIIKDELFSVDGGEVCEISD